MKDLEIQVTYDFICPWCWIGEEKLAQAIAVTERQKSTRLTFIPYLLNPNMPAAGMDRKQYRSAKFGSWARSQAMDAQVTDAGQASGLTFNYDIVEKTPNTLAAHRLVWRYQANGKDAQALVRAIFKAYFSEGRDIGDLEVLADIATAHGHDREDTLRFLRSDLGSEEVLHQVRQSHLAGVRSVPSVKIGEQTVGGAQSVEVFVEVLKHA